MRVTILPKAIILTKAAQGNVLFCPKLHREMGVLPIEALENVCFTHSRIGKWTYYYHGCFIHSSTGK